MDLSIIIPLYNEEESIPELADWIRRVMDENNYTYEIIMVDDGCNDGSWEVIENLRKENPSVIGIKFRRNYGKSAALNVGFDKAKGDVVVTMDADLQDSPDELPGLYKMIANDGYDLVSGWKQKRHDPISKTLPSKFFNRITRMVSGIKLHDFNCGLKAYRNAVVKSIEVFGEMHRYIPFIAKQAGFNKIGEKVVEHRARKYGITKFGLERFFNGFLDLLTISFISRFGKKPMHFFGLMGTFMFFIGFLISLYMGIDKLFFDIHGRLLAGRTEFYVALFVMMVGVQLFLTGYVAELISRNAADRNNYLIEEILDKD
jgi:glycosyltransferase involved in cell wall biosynthesis